MLNALLLLKNTFVSVPRMLLRNTPRAALTDGIELYRAVDKYAEQMRFNDLHSQARIRDVHAAELFGPAFEKVDVPFGAIDEQTGKTNQAELLYVDAVAKFLRAKNIFEFGTYMGRTTYHLAGASPEAFVTTLDLPEEAGSKSWGCLGNVYKGTERETKIRQLLCDSHKFDPAPYHQSMDFIYIDGDHSYAGVKNDTEKALQMLKPGGTVMWHDYGASSDLGLTRFFVEFTRVRPVFRLKKTSLLLYRDRVDAMTFKPFAMRQNPKYL
jgi:predicted O-methyltransferase YrrM